MLSAKNWIFLAVNKGFTSCKPQSNKIRNLKRIKVGGESASRGHEPFAITIAKFQI